MSDDTVLRIENLKTYFFLKEGVVRAVDGVNLTVQTGKVLGIVGESGCGKSITAHSILRIIEPPGRTVEGKILYYRNGYDPIDLVQLSPREQTIRNIRGKDISMIFQEPMTSFSPVHPIGSQVAEVTRLHDTVSPSEGRDRSIEMFRRVGIPRPQSIYDDYPHQLSGGMRQRAMIAMALMCRPRVLIADEPTTAIDVTVQAQVLRLLKSLQEEMKLSIIFITHDLGVIAQIADEVAVMYLGKVVEYGSVEQVFDEPLHPYSADLMRSIPHLGEGKSGELAVIQGTVPDAYSIPTGCSFHPRCRFIMAGLCNGAHGPELEETTTGHAVSCFLHNRDDGGERIEAHD